MYVVRRNREAIITDRNNPLLREVPAAELLDLRDRGAAPKRFPDVCGAQPPATFQFLPATGKTSIGFELAP